MSVIHSVHYDNFITHWKKSQETVTHHILILIVEGRVAYNVNETEVIGEAGDFIFFPKGIKRAAENHSSGLHRKYTMSLTPSKSLGPIIPLLSNQQFVKFKPHNFQYIQHRFSILYEESLNHDAYQALICESILHELLGLLSRELEKPEVTPMKMKFAQLIKAYILEHFREQLEIKQLAQLIHRSPNYTIAIFREVIGISPINYIHQLRILEACGLLINSNMSVSDISNHLGYYDTSYFFRIFKKHTSMSPTDFIKNGHHINVSQLFL